ncbi:MAG: hypothetical protein ACKN9T_00005, partial [Candidatus Methylumidiphilus sp.]
MAKSLLCVGLRCADWPGFEHADIRLVLSGDCHPYADGVAVAADLCCRVGQNWECANVAPASLPAK